MGFCRRRRGGGKRQGGAGGVASRLERDAAVVTQIVLRLAVQFAQVVRKAVRPNAMLRQQQRQGQQPAQGDAQKTPGRRIHKNQYTRAQKCYSATRNISTGRVVYRPTGRSRYSLNLKEAP